MIIDVVLTGNPDYPVALETELGRIPMKERELHSLSFKCDCAEKTLANFSEKDFENECA